MTRHSYKLKYEILVKHKIWVKPSAEQQFLYGHHIMKSGLARITEGTSQYQGVVVFSMNDLPLVCNIVEYIIVSRCVVDYLFNIV